jgi:hypothetical protein
MTAMLILHAMLAFYAFQRGWRLAPLLLAALPWLLLPLEARLSDLTIGGWWLPFSNLLISAGVFSTLALAYTAVVRPEPA